MKIKNITRYTYESTDFLGWRVSVQRCGRIITRYFSDLEYGTEEASHAALLYRDYIIQGLRQLSDDLESFMDGKHNRAFCYGEFSEYMPISTFALMT